MPFRSDSLQLCGVQDGDSLTAVAQQPKMAATWGAFALWCVGGGRVVRWGKAHSGGDSSSVQDNLKNVQQICGTSAAFAAVLVDETVVTWGNPDRAGESSKVQDPFSYPLGACSGKKMNMLPARHLQFLFPHYKL